MFGDRRGLLGNEHHPGVPARSRPLLLIVLLVVALTAMAGVAFVRSRAVFGTFAFWGMPERIDYCDRRYYKAGEVEGSPREFVALVSGRREWQRIGRTYAARPIYAVVQADQDPVCTMELYVPRGDGKYRRYGISGGP